MLDFCQLVQSREVSLLLSFLHKLVVNSHLLLILLHQLAVTPLAGSGIVTAKGTDGGIVDIGQSPAYTRYADRLALIVQA